MKIAVVSAFPPSKVTLNEYAFHLVKSFNEHQKVTEIVLLTDVHVSPNDLPQTSNDCKITVEKCWSFNSYKNLYTITKAIKKIQPDGVLFNLQFMKFGDKKIPAALGLMAPMLCKWMKVPSVVLLHNILEEVDLSSSGFTDNKALATLYRGIGRMLTRLILKANTVAVTMNKYVTILNESYGAKNVVCIPHGTFEMVEEEPDYSLSKAPLKIMTFGKFGTYKKVEIMIEAVQLVRIRSGLSLEIVIAGTDNPNVPGYLEGVKNQYHDVEGLHFTGYVEEDDVPGLFKESAIVVFPYTSTTGSSGVLHQAGSYGKAVVMPDLGDLALLVKEEGYQGEFFKPDNLESLVLSIEALLTNEAHRLQIAKANFKAATAYPMSRIADLYLNEFNNLITSTNAKTVSVVS